MAKDGYDTRVPATLDVRKGGLVVTHVDIAGFSGLYSDRVTVTIKGNPVLKQAIVKVAVVTRNSRTRVSSCSHCCKTSYPAPLAPSSIRSL